MLGGQSETAVVGASWGRAAGNESRVVPVTLWGHGKTLPFMLESERLEGGAQEGHN